VGYYYKEKRKEDGYYMKIMKKALLMISIIIMVSTLLTCDFLYRPMTLTLPEALYDATATEVDCLIEIFDKESEALVVKLEIVPADADDANNNNDDDDDLTQLLDIPAYVIIEAESLSEKFVCSPRNSDVMGTAIVKDVSVKATALHHQDAYDTVAIYNSDSRRASD
jgi:hypothetical protein